jgi:peptide/nickel transport system substrate-binding protein
MMSRRSRLLTAVLAAGALAALTACSTPAEPEVEVPQVFEVASNFPVVALDPYGQYSADAGLGFVAKQIYDTLIAPDGDGGYVAQLATEWEPTEDGKVWTFTLREAQYSDGTEFTSADVAASVQLMIAGAGPFAKSWEVIGVETPDERTVVFTQPTTGAAIMSLIPQLNISPAELAVNPDFFAKPVGLGPFAVESFTSEQEVVLVPNANYWGDPVVAEEVTIRTITDISARVTALLNGEIQAAWGVPDDQFGPLLEEPTLNTEVTPSYSQFTMWMNSKQETLAELEVREAIWKAIDFESINAALYPYSATPALAPVSQAVAGAGQFEPRTYDPDEAKAMLEDAGYGDGLTLRLQYSAARDFEQIAAAMKSDLAEVGVTLEVQAKEHAVWLEDLLALNFDINIQTTGPANGDPSSDLSRLYKCSANRTGFCSDELDELIAIGDAALDPAERTAAFLDVQEVIWDNAIGMFPLDVATTYAWSKTLEGFVPDPNFSPDLSAVKVVAAQ